MCMSDYDIFMNALRNVNPELAFVADYLKEENERKRNSDGLARTFEDCAAVEKDIYDKLNNAISKRF